MTELVSFRLNRSLLVRIDALASNRSDFIRQAVEEKLKRVGRKGQSAWDALRRTEGSDIRIRPFSGKVQRVEL
jgi:Arc/MetJ-type ribon-helix-helix transcriptional regulator